MQLGKKSTIENHCEDEQSEKDFLPIKERRVRRLISDSEDEKSFLFLLESSLLVEFLFHLYMNFLIQ